MPADVHRIRYVLPKFTPSAYRTLMHSTYTALGFGASERAQFRLHCIEVLVKHGWMAFHDAFPHVSRATVYRWHRQLRTSGNRLNALVPRSTRPHHRRQMVIPMGILGFLKAMREQHPHLSKYKLKPFLDAWCQTQGIPPRSVSWIGKAIARHRLFFGIRHRAVTRRRRARSGYTIRRTPSPDDLTIGYLQLDGVTVYWEGKKVIFLTALEVKTRMAWVRLVATLSSAAAAQFLQDILSEVPCPVHTIHTDNGSEFHAAFDAAVVSLQLLHLWSPPRSPKIHSHIERFNGTLQREFIDYAVDEAILNRGQFRDALAAWLAWYNTQRPHHALGMLTPHQYFLQVQKGAERLKCP